MRESRSYTRCVRSPNPDLLTGLTYSIPVSMYVVFRNLRVAVMNHCAAKESFVLLVIGDAEDGLRVHLAVA